MSTPTYRTFLTFGLLLFTASIPAFAQTRAGVQASITTPQLPPRNPAAADAAFHAQLREALSFRSISAAVARSTEIASTLPADASLTTFDSISAPCGFVVTAPLFGVFENAYFQGFKGNGGAILNECANFGVQAFSTPNFLAFNRLTTYGDGIATPTLPELIVVGPGKTTVSMEVSEGSRAYDHIAVIALSQGGVQETVEVRLTSIWQQVSVTGTNVQSVLIVGDPDALVIDNVSAQ